MFREGSEGILAPPNFMDVVGCDAFSSCEIFCGWPSIVRISGMGSTGLPTATAAAKSGAMILEKCILKIFIVVGGYSEC